MIIMILKKQTLTLVDGAIPVRSSLDGPGEAARRRWRNVSEPAAFDQSALFSSTLPSGSETTPADRQRERETT